MTTIIDDFDMCMECSNECTNLSCLTDSMNALNFNNNNINTIIIAKLAEKLTKEMNCVRINAKEDNDYILNIEVEFPEWFYDLDKKYQTILIKLIEPVINHYVLQEFEK